MSSEWRLLLEAGETGRENMLLDEALAVRVAEGHSAPVIRIYAVALPCRFAWSASEERAVAGR